MASGDTVLTATTNVLLSLSGTAFGGGPGYSAGLSGHDPDGHVVQFVTGGGDAGIYVTGVATSPFDPEKQYDVTIKEH